MQVKDKASAFAKDDHVRATALGVAGGMTTLGGTGRMLSRSIDYVIFRYKNMPLQDFHTDRKGCCCLER